MCGPATGRVKDNRPPPPGSGPPERRRGDARAGEHESEEILVVREFVVVRPGRPGAHVVGPLAAQPPDEAAAGEDDKRGPVDVFDPHRQADRGASDRRDQHGGEAVAPPECQMHGQGHAAIGYGGQGPGSPGICGDPSVDCGHGPFTRTRNTDRCHRRRNGRRCRSA